MYVKKSCQTFFATPWHQASKETAFRIHLSTEEIQTYPQRQICIQLRNHQSPLMDFPKGLSSWLRLVRLLGRVYLPFFHFLRFLPSLRNFGFDITVFEKVTKVYTPKFILKSQVRLGQVRLGQVRLGFFRFCEMRLFMQFFNHC